MEPDWIDKICEALKEVLEFINNVKQEI